MVVVSCLYWAQRFSFPVALAVFLTFLLAPLITALQRRGLRRLPSVILVVLLAAAVLGGGVWLVTAQVARLAGEAPKYTENIRGQGQVAAATGPGVGNQSPRRRSSEGVAGAWDLPATTRKGKDLDKPAFCAEQPTAVVLGAGAPTWLTQVPAVLSSLLATLAGLALALVLVVFMLLKT